MTHPSDPNFQGIDLRTLRGEKDTLAGFYPSVGLLTLKLKNEQGEEHDAQMPVLDLNYELMNGHQGRISLPPDVMMPLIATLSEFAVKLQGASPPAPPSGQDANGE